MADALQRFWTPLAWIAGAWQRNVLLTVDAMGRWSDIAAGSAAPAQSATLLHGPVLPGLVNAHSHAFQRAFAGLAERRQNAEDNFWSWRERMYGVAQRVTPAHLQAVAAQLYAELLEGGYTQVCEFHYLHHAPHGQSYSDRYAMTWALTQAASQAGLGLTVLPTLYERAGFAMPALRDDQQRFAADAAWVAELVKAVAGAGAPLVNAGAAIHSLRAATPASIHLLKKRLADADGPRHIHVAEQMAEVNDCLASTGLRPLQWLCEQGVLDARWHLVHATHSTAQEVEAVAGTGAQIVMCPSTEANLGDGLTDMARWLNAPVGMAIGSDSHICRNWREELRWLEYGQRLQVLQRNVCAAPSLGMQSSAQRLFDAALAGGGHAAGLGKQGLVVGARADMLVLDAQCPGLLGVPLDYTLDALVFAADTAAIDAVYVGGRQLVQGGRHVARRVIAERFVDTMQALWATPGA
ncbi:MAG: formimidoylglutamate deiminase [Burkholderiaceae bacterium]